MQKKILIAMDESENAARAVEFVARSFSPDHSVTLFSILLDTASLCKMNSPELTPLFKSQQSAFCLLEDKKRELVQTAMQQARKVLVAAGFREDRIQIQITNKKRGIARDILDEAEIGYDVIAIGRRGLSGIKEFIMGSTSQKVLNGARHASVLIVN